MVESQASYLQWFTTNPIIGDGEIAISTDDGRKKVGNGITRWRELPYDLTAALATEIEAREEGDTDVLASANAYSDSLVLGLLDDRGNYDPTGTGQFPAGGGSGAAGTIKKGDLWYISVDGTITSSDMVPVAHDVTVGFNIRALVDAPGQEDANWNFLEVKYIQQQADWDQDDDTQRDYIKNKPGWYVVKATTNNSTFKLVISPDISPVGVGTARIWGLGIDAAGSKPCSCFIEFAWLSDGSVISINASAMSGTGPGIGANNSATLSSTIDNTIIGNVGAYIEVTTDGGVDVDWVFQVQYNHVP